MPIARRGPESLGGASGASGSHRATLPLAAAAALYLVGAVLALALGRLPPGLTLGGAALDWRGDAGARAALRQASRLPLRLRLDPELDAAEAVPPASLGLTLDEERSLAAARSWADSRAARLRVLSLGWPRVLRPLAWQVEEGAAAAGLTALKRRLDRAAVGGRIAVVDGAAQLEGYRQGRALDVAASIRSLAAAGAAGLEGWSPVFAPLEPAEDPQVALRAARQSLAAPLTLEAYDPIRDQGLSWGLQPQHWTATVSGLAWQGDTWRWRVEAAAAEDLAASLSAELGGGRYLAAADLASAIAGRLDGDAGSFARIWHAARTVTVAEGDTLAAIGQREGLPFPWIVAANPGVGDALSPGQQLTLPSLDGLVPLPPQRGRRILVHLGEQRLEAWENGSRRWSWPVSTGIPSSPTATGVFQVQGREDKAFASAWDLWMPRFIAIYRPDPRREVFNGFHGLPWKESGERLWAGLIGQPASYGCIVLDDANADTLYDWALDGTVVEVRE